MFTVQMQNQLDIVLIHRWLRALWNGTYNQGRGSLRQTLLTSVEDKKTTFCCLGVLCDLIGVGEWQNNAFRLNGTSNLDYIPLEIAPRVGLTAFGAKPDGRQWDINGKSYQNLSKANDDQVSFKDIAQALYNYYLGTVVIISMCTLDEYLEQYDDNGRRKRT